MQQSEYGGGRMWWEQLNFEGPCNEEGGSCETKHGFKTLLRQQE